MIPHSNRFDLELERLQWAQDNKHICINPYIETHVRSDSINPCCRYQSNDSTIDFDNPTKVKNNIESGVIDKNCNICHSEEESNNQISLRIRHLLQHTTQQVVDFLETKKTQEFTDYFILSNECNMACRMCSGQLSSLYSSIWTNEKKQTQTLSDNSERWKFLQSSIKQKIHDLKGGVYRITVLGGEGTIQKDLYKLTDWLMDEKLSDQVHLQIGTNGSVFHDDIFEKWCKNFRHLSFAISIDSTNADNFLYVRYPAKFGKIRRNLQNFKELSNGYSNFNFYITPTFYINNISYLKDFLDYFEDFDSSTKCLGIHDNTLENPRYLKLSSLPNYIKTQLVEQITGYIDNYSLLERNHVFRISINSMLSQLQITDFSVEIWEQYLSTSARWDQLTGTDISIHNKQLWDLFSDEDKALYQQHRSKQDNLSN
jgi:organic radical activating enzyme